MLETYYDEIEKKWRRKIFFWIVVFIFATALYFFFKGKYLAVNIDWKNALSNTGSTFSWLTLTGNQTGTTDIISLHSFGIVNVKVKPTDSAISLNDAPYASDSKLRVDYGKYHLVMSHEGYLTGSMDFSISDEKNFYIDNVILLKKPAYSQFLTGSLTGIIGQWRESWLQLTHSWVILHEGGFATGKIVTTKKLIPLGGNKFLSGSQIVEFSDADASWTPQTNQRIISFVTACSNTVYMHSLYFCPQSNEAISSNWKLFTGVVSIHKNSLITKEKIYIGNIDGDSISISNTGALSDATSTQYIHIANNWYGFTNSWELVWIDPTSGKIETLENDENFLKGIFTHIDYTDEIGSTNFVIGDTSSWKTLAILSQNKGNIEKRLLSFPNIPLEEVRIYEVNRNFFIKTRNALLFMYRENNELEWIVEGKIIAFSPKFCLYEKDGNTWIADWSYEIEKK